MQLSIFLVKTDATYWSFKRGSGKERGRMEYGSARKHTRDASSVLWDQTAAKRNHFVLVNSFVERR
jgi:hypothetical protein